MNILILQYFAKKFLLTNSVDPDQMPHCAASDLGLHCLHNTPKWVSGLKWVNSTA